MALLAFLGLILRISTAIAFSSVLVAVATVSLPWDSIDSLQRIPSDEQADFLWAARSLAISASFSYSLLQARTEGNPFSEHGILSAVQTANDEMFIFVQIFKRVPL